MVSDGAEAWKEITVCRDEVMEKIIDVSYFAVFCGLLLLFGVKNYLESKEKDKKRLKIEEIAFYPELS